MISQVTVLDYQVSLTYQVRMFMFQFYNKLLPAVFDDYFISYSQAHRYISLMHFPLMHYLCAVSVIHLIGTFDNTFLQARSTSSGKISGGPMAAFLYPDPSQQTMFLFNGTCLYVTEIIYF